MVNLRGLIMELSVVYLSLTTLVLHANAARAAAAGGNSYCVTAFDKFLCEKLTKTATNWNQAMTMGLKEAMKHADLVKSKGEDEPLDGTGCAETYINIQARLKECQELVNKGDTGDEINFKLSASVTSLEDCKGILQDKKKDQTPFYVLNRHFDHVLKICLAIDKSKYEKKFSD